MKSRRYILKSRPQKQLIHDCFGMQEFDVPSINMDEVLVKVEYLSIDPYMRGRISDQKSYADPVPVGATMLGGVVGTIIDSRHKHFKPGDKIIGSGGWAEHCVLNGNTIRRLDSEVKHPSLYLGALGMPGITAWYGINHVLNARAGSTVVISSAAGTVGSVAGQLALAKKCNVIGIAGSEEKCKYVRDELQFQTCLNYRAPNFYDELRASVSSGIDNIFENVGGPQFDACLPHLNPHSAIALCGLISIYDGMEYPLKNLRYLLSARANLKGFIITEHLELWPQALQELESIFASGNLKIKESIYTGLDCAPQALIDLLHGNNFGKQIIQL